VFWLARKENAELISVNPTGPTSYEDVNTILHLMCRKVQAILSTELVGFYLYGSLSLGDFDSTSSDIDFLIVTAEDVAKEALERLRDMHANIASSNLAFATRLEGSYIPRRALRRYNPENASHPTIGVDWPFQIAWHGSNWIIERHIVREHGMIVWGPSPQTLIDPIALDELRVAVCEQLKRFWQNQLDEPEWLRPRDYQAFAVLTLCRALYTLHHGAVSSKPKAATWAQEVYPRWKPMIERALLWRSRHENDDMTETMIFLREALKQAQEMCSQTQ
jgi:hypothetical protein